MQIAVNSYIMSHWINEGNKSKSESLRRSSSGGDRGHIDIYRRLGDELKLSATQSKYFSSNERSDSVEIGSAMEQKPSPDACNQDVGELERGRL